MNEFLNKLKEFANDPGVIALSTIGGAIGLMLLVKNVIYRGLKLLIAFTHGKKARYVNNKQVNAFEVINTPCSLLPNLFPKHGLFNDLDMPYMHRDDSCDIRKTIEAQLEKTGRLFILSPYGYGKSREAGEYLERQVQLGGQVIRVLASGYLNEDRWLDVPSQFPDSLFGKNVFIYVDDLRLLFPTSIENKVANTNTDGFYFTNTYVQRLMNFIIYFIEKCGDQRVKVIVNVDLEDWGLVQDQFKANFWRSFEIYELPPFSIKCKFDLFIKCSEQAKVEIPDDDVTDMVLASDGTPLNVLLNLRRALSQGSVLSLENYTPKLNKTWEASYENTCRSFPAAKYIYDAIDLIHEQGHVLPELKLIVSVAKKLMGNPLIRIFRRPQINRAMSYLVSNEILVKQEGGFNYFEPSHGQIPQNSQGLKLKDYLPKIKSLLIKQRFPNAVMVGHFFFTHGYYEEAKSMYLRCINFDQSGAIYLLLALTYSRLGNSKKAQAYFDDLFRFRPIHATDLAFYGEELVRWASYEEAERVLKEAIEMSSTEKFSFSRNYINGNSNCLLGFIRLLQNKTDEATEYLRKAIAFQPYDTRARMLLTSALINLDRLDEAKDILNNKVELNDHVDKNDSTLGKLLNALGSALFKKGRISESEGYFRKVISYDPTNIDAVISLGVALCELKQYDEAERIFRKVINDHPENSKAHATLGVILFRRNQLQDAEISLSRAVHLAPNDAEILLNLGAVYCKSGDFSQAEAILRKALTINPKSVAALSNLGAVYIQQERLAEAQTMLEQALEVNPSDEAAKKNLQILTKKLTITTK